MTPKNTTKPKQTYCDQTQNPPPKHAKVTKGEKLAKFIYVVVEELKLSCKRKTEPIKTAVK